jgi:GNAT superfamily N-acetyltransferase
MPDPVLTVRPAMHADIAAVDALLARSYPALLKADYPPSVLVTVIPRLARAQPALVTCGTYYVVEDLGGRVVGAGGWTQAGPPGSRAAAGLGHVRHVVTDHRQTRRGIGRAMMEHVLATSRAAGLLRLECLSTLTAVPFYAALGFAPLGAVEVSLAPGIGFRAVRMERGL